MSRVGARLRAVAALLILAATGAIITPAAVAAPASPVPVCQNDFGSKTPVLLVHGFNEGTEVWGAMSKAIKPAIPEVKVVTLFDYPSTKWVNDPSVGPKLASVIRCLATDSENNGGAGKVIIVAHSMGGLIVRCAVDPKCAGPDAVNQQQIGLVITLGTPNTGSLLATTGNGLSATGVIACEAILALQTGLNLPCPDLGGWLFGANSPAAQAMAIGLDGKPSQDLSALQPLPATVPLDAIAGQVTVTTSLFDLPPFHVSGPQIDLGDIVVPVASALDGAPPTSPEHPGTNTPHPGPGSGTVTISCGTISVSNLMGPLPASVVPDVTCWHQTETTDSAWQSKIFAAIQSAAQALSLRACTPATISAALAAKDPTNAAQRTLVTFACADGWAVAEIHQPLTLSDGSIVQDTGFAILRQTASAWTSEGLGDGTCLNVGLCPGYALPPPAVLHLLLQKAGISTATPACPNVTPPVPAIVIGPGCAKPTVLYFSSDQTVSIQGITWSSWNASGATGHGTWNLVDCNPNCAQGPITTSPATLTLSNVQNGLYTVLITTGNGPATTWNYPDNWPQHT